jgi:hypothetical protein
MEEVKVDCLPLSVVLSILQLLPQEAFISRLVNKSCRDVFNKYRSIQANYADLPLWVLREFHSSLRSDFERKQLLTARASQGECCFITMQGSLGPSRLHLRPMLLLLLMLLCSGTTGDLPGVKWLLQQGTRCGPSVSWAAAAGGHTHILQLLACQDPPCAFDETTCKAAASTGQLETLRWLRSLQPEPCPWSASTCEAAAAGGHIEVGRK